MNIPLEIWKEVSLYFPYNFLTISTELTEIYDESWFEKKVKFRYPNCKQHNNSWEFLYKRLLKSGKIHLYENVVVSLDMDGIKRSDVNLHWYSILTFDGDLCTSYKRGNLTLLDTNVLDIHSVNYIKNNEWYHWYNGKQLICKSDNSFISCLYYDHFCLAITINQIYQYEIDTKNLIIINFPNIKKIISVDGIIIIQTIDGSLYKYDPDNQEIKRLHIDPVDKLFNHCLKLKNGSVKYFRYDRYRKMLLSEDISVPIDNLRGATSCNNAVLILIDNNVYKINPNRNLELFYENVKNIENSYFII